MNPFYTQSIFHLGVTFFGSLLIINAFNLLDNVDGLSAGIAFIAALIFLFISLLHGHFQEAAVICIFMGSVLGFLAWNFHPAKIFMGDAGSLFLGSMLMAITFMTTADDMGSNLKMAMLIPPLIFAVPIYDTFSVIFLRIKDGRKVYIGGVDHFSHRLIRLGLGEKIAVAFAYLLAFATGLITLLLLQVDLLGAGIIIVIFASLFAALILMEYYTRREMRIARKKKIREARLRALKEHHRT